jgi:hypothetical protein
MIFWALSASTPQSGPRTVNSTGKPRCAEKPCWERSWMLTRREGIALSAWRMSAMNWACVVVRSERGLSVTNSTAVLTSPPPKPPTAVK